MQPIPVLLAGGSGTRLWPVSREAYPKQFCTFIGDQSLLQNTALRARSICGANELIVVTNEEYYFLCKDQLDALAFTKVHYILEPCSRNTAPALALAAWYAKKHFHQDAALFVLPADHEIKEPDCLHAVLEKAHPLLEEGHLIIFGIKPTAPKTGYGYIKKGTDLNGGFYEVSQFVEKPSLAVAETYLVNGNFYWNSGIFLFKASDYLDELNEKSPDIYTQTALTFHKTALNANFFRADKIFADCRSGSIDYELMEKTRKAVMFPLDIAWNDLGCWSSVAESLEADANNNVLQGQVLVKHTQNSFISSDDKQIVAIGIKDQLIISTPDAILVANKAWSQEVKVLVEQMKAKKQDVATKHKRIYRPWGYFESLLLAPTYQVKFLCLKPGAAISLQLHLYRSEHWTVVEGEAEVINGEKVFTLKKNQSTYISKNTRHRVSNPLKTPLVIIEVQSGDYLDESDIIRFEDIYGRSMDLACDLVN